VGESTPFVFTIHIGESVLPHLGDPNDFLFFFLLNKVITICFKYLMEKIISPLNRMLRCKKDLDKKVKVIEMNNAVIIFFFM